jgi:uncharacterized protein (TIGR03067 family)
MILAAGMAAAADKPRDELSSPDRKELQGAWMLVSVEAGVSLVSSLSMDDLADARLIVQGDRYHFRLGKLGLEATYTLAPVQQPNAIDLVITSGPAKGKVIRAIYALQGDTLRICYRRLPGGERPTACSVRPDGETLIITCKRQTP